jgi:hypothetical protein
MKLCRLVLLSHWTRLKFVRDSADNDAYFLAETL